VTTAHAPTVVPHATTWRARRRAHERTARTVEGNRIRCSHFDAYRFLTPAGRPLNQLAPTGETQHDNEQPGCLHANMDLRMRNSGTSSRRGAWKRHEADNKGAQR
jgi:hypothetical protein